VRAVAQEVTKVTSSERRVHLMILIVCLYITSRNQSLWGGRGWRRVVAIGGRELTDDPGPDTSFTFTVFFQWPLWTRHHLRM
jgi:hypothetical protein